MKVSFLYTLAANQALFAPYIEKLEGIEVSHHLNEQVLKDAQAGTDVTKDVHAALAGIEGCDKPDIIVCTCSSIGAMAEGFSGSAKVLRVDRAMAEAAVVYQDIKVLAALESALKPTQSLLEECAKQNGTQPKVELTVVPDAWTEYYQKGDLEGYAQAIGAYILEQYGAEPKSRESHIIVLAQASMTPAVNLVETARKHQVRMSNTNQKLLSLPKILSSPEICMKRLQEQLKGE